MDRKRETLLLWLACVWADRYAAVAIAFNDPYIR
jgi:hypothetical protein